MTSNIKAKTPAKDSPTEPFKRAVGICLRAIAGKGDIEVSFAAERPGLSGAKARLPEPARRLNEREIAVVRGAGERADPRVFELLVTPVQRQPPPVRPDAGGVPRHRGVDIEQGAIGVEHRDAGHAVSLPGGSSAPRG